VRGAARDGGQAACQADRVPQGNGGEPQCLSRGLLAVARTRGLAPVS
jgi:hypothetical protein